MDFAGYYMRCGICLAVNELVFICSLFYLQSNTKYNYQGGFNVNNTAIKLLEFNKTKEQLKEHAISGPARDRIGELLPSVDPAVINTWMKETTEACAILDRSSSVPLHSLSGVDSVISKLGKYTNLLPEELATISYLLKDCKKLKRFMQDKSVVAPTISQYAYSIYELNELADEIDRCIQNGRVDDRASSELAKARKHSSILEDKIKAKVDSILRSPAYSQYLQDNIVSTRNGRYVIPIKKEYRKNVDGTVIDSSSSGSTLFVEPAEIRKLQDELSYWAAIEENEVYKILAQLTNLTEACQKEISVNIETMAHYDFIMAKAKYSRSIGGNPVSLNTKQYIKLIDARHPLLGQSAVPLNLVLGEGYDTLVITGPNTGGKTVALKTLGLLTMMVQSGLHVPAGVGSEFTVFADILVDIGDGQSIEQSLSTFSAHIKNIISILECAGKNTLVIIDELGAGTDPAEGMGLAIAVLDSIHRKGATSIVTTHYSEIKNYAAQYEGFENGCMEFDIDTLKPLYRLKIGVAGESNAFLIALRLGMDKNIIEKAHEVTYKEKKEYSVPENKLLEAIQKNQEIVEQHAAQMEKHKKAQQLQHAAENQNEASAFNIGDCVYISSMDRTGIVYEPEDSKGDIGVMVMKKKLRINKKRLTLYIDGKEMYPDNYDYDIVFESKDNRKRKHRMEKGHTEGNFVEIRSGNAE